MSRASSPSDRAGALMLDLLAPAHETGDDKFHAMNDADWEHLIRLSREHRMAPMLHHRDRNGGHQWPLPEKVREAWRADYRRAAMRALEFERALCRIAEVMAQAKIPFIALKGSWLAWHAYPHPALRPMRDIDLWVPVDRALSAHAALIAAGATAITHGYESADALVGDAKTLPPLWSPTGRIQVELHMHLSHHHHGAAGIGDDGAHGPDNLLHDRTEGDLRGHPIGYLTATDNLLHLIVHSAYDHGFDNGPAVFDDIAFILATQAIDWARFWGRAGAQGWIKGAILLLILTSDRHGPQPVDWMGNVPDDIPVTVLEAVPRLTLQSASDRATIAFLGAVDARVQESTVAPWPKLLTVSQARLAMFFGVASDNPLAWLAYPLWLLSGAWRIVRGYMNSDVRRAGQRRALVSGWINMSAQSRRR